MSVWKRFKERFPNADLSRFTQTDWFGDTNAVYFKSNDGKQITQVFDKSMSNKYYLTDEMKKALGHPAETHHAADISKVVDLSNFPQELIFNSKPKLPVPAPGHADKPRTFDLSNREIFVTPTDSFKMKFRDVFIDTKLTHHSGKESRRWLESPDMNYWPQQLNFAIWCATTGCCVSSRLLFEDDGELRLPKQVRSFFWFHVYFTVRRILHEMGGIQNSVTLPGDDAFDQKKNPYDISSYKRLCNEFGISPSTEFRFYHGMNHGLGNVYIYYSNLGYGKTEAPYPGTYKFSDEGGSVSELES